MCSSGKKAFVFEIDWTKDFVKEITRHEEKLTCQNIYFQHYAKLHPELLLQPDDMSEGQVLGHCFIHPTADIHHTAIVRYHLAFNIIAWTECFSGSLC